MEVCLCIGNADCPHLGTPNSSFPVASINLFINSDAILTCDALWSIQGKKTLFTNRYRRRSTAYRKNIAMNVLSYNGDMSINFLSMLSHQFARMA